MSCRTPNLRHQNSVIFLLTSFTRSITVISSITCKSFPVTLYRQISKCIRLQAQSGQNFSYQIHRWSEVIPSFRVSYTAHNMTVKEGTDYKLFTIVLIRFVSSQILFIPTYWAYNVKIVRTAAHCEESSRHISNCKTFGQGTYASRPSRLDVLSAT